MFCQLRAVGVCTGLLLATFASINASEANTSMTVVQVYDEESCSGAPLQLVFTPTTDCSSSSSDACSLEEEDLGLFASAGCTKDPQEFAADALGESPYVLVEIHRSDSNCDGLEGVTAYRVDSGCHPTVESGTSFQVDWDDVSPSFKMFEDASCSSTPTYQLNLARDSSECVDGSIKLKAVNVHAAL
ncbi:hypothetical protein P3T76_011232 [Phytophthora citrophthora]|uniref:Uncharacterized protein n=1 Tax=Phytophthora citrophthora TaxID=4793 RepID=A0AAD9GA03_9STRA|nr:hypothetical protein P3T76_011232 [Phytophthora citrophthora]